MIRRPPRSTLFPYRRSSDLDAIDSQTGLCSENYISQCVLTSTSHYVRFRAVPRANRSLMTRSEEHTSELQSRRDLVCRLLLEKKKKKHIHCLIHRLPTIFY